MTATETTTLATWLLERIEDDEAVARAAIGAAVWANNTGRWVSAEAHDQYGGPIELVFAVAEDGARTQVGRFDGAWLRDERRDHIARHDPARVLAECAAKRAILELHQCMLEAYPEPKEYCCCVCSAGGEYPGGWPCDTLRALASVYADAPGWREEWR